MLNSQQSQPTINVHLPNILGKGVATFWTCKKRYTAWKGSRGSKKSKTVALFIIWAIMKFPLSHALVIRRYFNTLKNSCYADLQWACRRLKVSHLWQFKKGELIATYLPTGQQILFRGADNPDSITSISVPFGGICWVWFEEAFQIESEGTFDMIDESIRAGFIDANGDDIGMPEGYYKRVILTFNPWSPKTWIKKRFFDTPDDAVLAMTTTYKINEWLLDEDRKRFEDMYIRNPSRARVACDGEWGIEQGLIFENYTIKEFDEHYLINDVDDEFTYINMCKYGLDFGYADDPFAFIAIIVNRQERKLYIYDEIYKQHLKNLDIIRELESKHFNNEIIIADSAEPKSIDTLRDGIYDNKGKKHKLPNIKPAKKGKGSILSGINKIKDYEIIVHPRCTNTISELSTYCWDKDRETNELLPSPVDKNNHLMDALRYAMESVGQRGFSFDEMGEDY